MLRLEYANLFQFMSELMVAAFSESEDHAGTLGMLVSVPMSFLVGAFFPLPSQAEVVTVFLPWRQALMALQLVLSYGAQLQNIMPNITEGMLPCQEFCSHSCKKPENTT